MDSPFISTIKPSYPYFNQTLQISPSNPQVFNVGSVIQPVITFSQTIQVMQLDFIVTSPVVNFIATIGTNTTKLNATVITLPDGTYDYVIIVPASLQTPVTKVTIVIRNTATTNITGFTIEGCIGNHLTSVPILTSVTLVMFVHPYLLSSVQLYVHLSFVCLVYKRVSCMKWIHSGDVE